MSLRFPFINSDVDLGKEDFMCNIVGAKMFLRVTGDGKVILRSTTSC